MIFTEHISIINEASLFGQKIDVKKLQDEDYCKNLAKKIKETPESEYKTRENVASAVIVLSLIAGTITLIAATPLSIACLPGILLADKLSSCCTSKAETEKVIKAIDMLLLKLENQKKNNPNDKSIEKDIEKLKKNKKIFDNKSVVADKVSKDASGKYYNGFYNISKDIYIPSLTAALTEQIMNNGYINDYYENSLKDSDYPVEFIEQIALVSKSEWDKRFESDKGDSGDYYNEWLKNPLNVNKHYIEILNENSDYVILYCKEEKTCYFTSYTEDVSNIKLSFDLLYSSAKKCLDEYNKLSKNKSLNESYIGGDDMDNNVLAFSGNNGGSYMHDALYESYIQAKIDAEDRLAFALKESMVISEADYSNIRAIQEAKLSDKVKATWKKFIAFIKGLVAKFMESLSNILLDEKAYLEKYKDIILNKKPKEDMEYSYTGNYTKGINRLINTEVPMFDYYKYRKELEAEGDAELVQKIMSGKQFNYDDGETLAEQFKSYFLALEDGQQEGKFANLNMTDIYNFCYNFNKIKGIVDKDINRLEASTRAIENAINKELAAAGNDAAGDKVENTTTNTQTNTTNQSANKTTVNKASATIDGEKVDADVVDNKTGAKLASAIISNRGSIISEKVEISGDKPSSDATSKMSSTQNRDADAEKDAASAGAAVAKDANDVSKAANKWIDVCRPLIAAKLTACQQIAKDYMDIIRAHVRSYGGVDKKSKEGNKGKDTGSKYSKHSDVEKAKANAERAKAEADKAGEAAKEDKK